MKLSIEVKDEKKVTTYTMDLKQAEVAVGKVKQSVEGFLKETFKKETFEKVEK